MYIGEERIEQTLNSFKCDVGIKSTFRSLKKFYQAKLRCKSGSEDITDLAD